MLLRVYLLLLLSKHKGGKLEANTIYINICYKNRIIVVTELWLSFVELEICQENREVILVYQFT